MRSQGDQRIERRPREIALRHLQSDHDALDADEQAAETRKQLTCGLMRTD